MTFSTIVTSDLDLINASLLDVHRSSEYPEVSHLMNEVYSTIRSIKGHQSTEI